MQTLLADCRPDPITLFWELTPTVLDMLFSRWRSNIIYNYQLVPILRQPLSLACVDSISLMLDVAADLGTQTLPLQLRNILQAATALFPSTLIAAIA